MGKIVFLTFNDYPGGIFSGQVIDVCKFLADKGADVELLSFVSLRTYFKTASVINKQYVKSSVIYMSPGVNNWKRNVGRLKRRISRLKPDSIIARGPFAAWLALACRDAGLVKRVVFDGRGAYEAEFKEYNVAQSVMLNSEIRQIEETVVLKSDFRIAVSQALVEYWRREFNYDKTTHVVIPCTLRSASSPILDGAEMRRQLGYNSGDIVIVYSGSFAGWQSFGLLDEIGGKLLVSNPAVKILVLAPDATGLKILNRFPDRVVAKWLPAEQVGAVLSACDYGWLVRENSVTNEVASPVKFAEYLHAGLPVLISPRLGDFSAFVEQYGCGQVVSSELPELKSLSGAERERYKQLAASHFFKVNYTNQYKLVSG